MKTGLRFSCTIGNLAPMTFAVVNFTLNEALSSLFTLSLTLAAPRSDIDRYPPAPNRAVHRVGEGMVVVIVAGVAVVILVTLAVAAALIALVEILAAAALVSAAALTAVLTILASVTFATAS
ncbi:hypothetical protein [Photorhabdus viridis]|uniref:hypothetical protein n=1 Tax=Photorhabdus viridis TaxID=3163327 RepID=UPI0033074F5A